MSATPNSDAARRLIEAIGRHIGVLTAQTIVETSCWRARTAPGGLRAEDLKTVAPEIEKGIRLFVKEPQKQQLCLAEVSELSQKKAEGPQLPSMVKVPIKDENSLLEARGMARQMCAKLGFSLSEQTQVATVVSELARNIVNYAGTGTVTLISFPAARPSLQVNAEDRGPGIPNLQSILDGQNKSKTGMGLGLRGSRNLMDQFDIDTGPTGTRIVATKYRR